MDESSYQKWRVAKLVNYPQNAEELIVSINTMLELSGSEKAAIIANCCRANMAIYRCRDQSASRDSVRAFSAGFGLHRLDHHLCTHEDGVSELSMAHEGVRTGYVPYSNRSLSWHTDGYYNQQSHRVNAVILHCVRNAKSGGENKLMDPEIAYIQLRDENPAFITALEHPNCLTIPENPDAGGELRPAVSGPVFSWRPTNGKLHMRYSARKKFIQWRDDETTRAARDFLTEILNNDNEWVFHYRLKPGEGLISNNVLHNRTSFEDRPGMERLLYRARYFEPVEAGTWPKPHGSS